MIFCMVFHVKIRIGDSDKVEATILMVLPETVGWWYNWSLCITSGGVSAANCC